MEKSSSPLSRLLICAFKKISQFKKILMGESYPNKLGIWQIPFPLDEQESNLYTEIQANKYFDTDWYHLAYSNEIEYHLNLLLDYLRAGIQNGRDPSPYFNTILYRREQDVPAEQAVAHFLRSGRMFASGAYRDQQTLLAVQSAYRTKTETCFIEDRRSDPKPFAVYLQCGAGALDGGWQQDSQQPFDLIVNHYDPTYVGKIPCAVEFRQAGILPGTKFTSFNSILENYPNILAPYENIMLLDDDILFDAREIGRLFSIIQQYGWEMAQACLSKDSHSSYPVFTHSGQSGFRRVNGVEIMMPVFSKRILGEVKDLIGQTISGWGFDSALSVVAGRKDFKAAVVDDVLARHVKPINADIGAYYQMLHRADIYPEIEFTHLQKKYGYTKPLFYEI